MTGIERLRKLTDATLGHVHVASVTHYYEDENDVEWDERTRLSELLASIYSQINREQDAMVADSPYEALPPEEREAIAWVRDHGGLDHVKAEWRSRVPYDLYERRRQRLLGHIAECEAALGRRNVRIEELEGLLKAFTNENSDLRRRAMPEVYEWPAFDDGEQVLIGDMAVFPDGQPHEVDHIEFFANHFCKLRSKGTPWVRPVFKGQRVKRPAVPAGDGEPLEVGQTVWEVDGTGHPFKVVSIRPSTGRAMEPTVVTCDAGDGTSEHILPSQLTHQRPVLDADGVPIKVGDTVYFTDGREQKCNTVVYAKYDYKDEPYVQLGRLNEVGYPTYTNCSCIDPLQLTHTKPEPDSWSSVWADVSNGNETPEGMMRRCRALAERERGE